MDLMFALRLLWLFSCPQLRHSFPCFGCCYCPDQPPPTPNVVFKQVTWCVFYHAWPSPSSHLRVIWPSISLILDYIAIAPSPTNPPPTQAPAPASMLCMVKIIMHLHVLIALLRCPLASFA